MIKFRIAIEIFAMGNFKKHCYAQDAMMVINFEEQIQLDPFALTLHTLIEKHINLSAFYDKYKNDAGGRAAYDPAILLKIVLYSYYRGVRSSRDIQWSCEHNVMFMALACGMVPHFTSIASFVSSYPDAIAAAFEEVLLVCDQEGLLGHELIAIDGCKMSSNAAKEHSGTLAELEEKRKKIRKHIDRCLKEHQKLDGRRHSERDRKKQLEQKSETLLKQYERISQFLKTAAPRLGQGKRPKEVKSNITDNESAKMTGSNGTIQGYIGIAAVDKKRQVIVDAQAFGEAQEHHTLRPVIESIQTRYDNIGIEKNLIADQIVTTADTGYANEANYAWLKESGHNAYVPDQHFRQRDKIFSDHKLKYGKRHQANVKGIKSVIPASEFVLDAKNKLCWCPEGNLMWLRNETIDEYGKQKLFFEGRLTDCRSCPRKNECLRSPDSPNTREGYGRQVSFTVNKRKSPTRWMQRRVDSRYGKQVYGHRMSVVEPVFANMCANKGLDRFSLRGKRKVQGQWQLYCMVHNIEKIANYGTIGKL